MTDFDAIVNYLRGHDQVLDDAITNGAYYLDAAAEAAAAYQAFLEDEEADPQVHGEMSAAWETTIEVPVNAYEAALLIQAWDHYQDHRCELGAIQLADGMGSVLWMIMERLIEDGQIPEEWRDNWVYYPPEP